MGSMRRTTRQSLVRLAIKRNSRAEISVRVMALARPIYPSMISANTDSDFCGIGNFKVSQLFGLVVLLGVMVRVKGVLRRIPEPG